MSIGRIRLIEMIRCVLLLITFLFSLYSTAVKTKEITEANIKELETPNGYYVIKRDINLNGVTVTIGENSTLRFRKGSFSDGGIIGKNIKLINRKNRVIFKNVATSLDGTDLVLSWYSDFTQCLSFKNENCTISIFAGEYTLRVPKGDFLKIGSDKSIIGKGKVIIHPNFTFDIGNNVTMENIEFDANDKVSLWMHCHPNNLTLKRCKFRNYYGAYVAFLQYDSGSNPGVSGLFVYDCEFGRIGSKEDGIIGNNNGSSRAIATVKCRDIKIRNCVFKDQYGYEDGDAIVLSMPQVADEKDFPTEGSPYKYHYGDIHAEITGNTFYNVPKSPIKLFGGSVTITDNRMTSGAHVTCALFRAYNANNIVAENNIIENKSGIDKILELDAVSEAKVNNTVVIIIGEWSKPFNSLLDVKFCKNISIRELKYSDDGSFGVSANDNSYVFNLSGSNFAILDSDIHVRNAFTFLNVKNNSIGLNGLRFEDTKMTVSDSLQNAFLCNTNLKFGSRNGVFRIKGCNMNFSNTTFSRGGGNIWVQMDTIFFENSIINNSSNMLLSGKDISVSSSEIWGVDVLNSDNVVLNNVKVLNTIDAITLSGEVKSFTCNDLIVPSDRSEPVFYFKTPPTKVKAISIKTPISNNKLFRNIENRSYNVKVKYIDKSSRKDKTVVI